jgi:1-acyl-sn-glycerol-3-phosphate acyltransferase
MTQDNTSSFPVQFQGQVWAQWLLRLAGWRYRFDGLPSQQGVFIAYPHTSNWDFVVMILVKWATGIRTQFWAKDSLFRVPLLGPWLRWVGGVAIDRKASSGVVGEMIRVLRQPKIFTLVFVLAQDTKTRVNIFGWRFRPKARANTPRAGAAVFTNSRCKRRCLWLWCASITGNVASTSPVFSPSAAMRSKTTPVLSKSLRAFEAAVPSWLRPFNR